MLDPENTCSVKVKWVKSVEKERVVIRLQWQDEDAQVKPFCLLHFVKSSSTTGVHMYPRWKSTRMLLFFLPIW